MRAWPLSSMPCSAAVATHTDCTTVPPNPACSPALLPLSTQEQSAGKKGQKKAAATALKAAEVEEFKEMLASEGEKPKKKKKSHKMVAF